MFTPRLRKYGMVESVHVRHFLQPTKLRDTFKIVFFGAAGVGKTCLISRFLKGTFTREHHPTIEDMYRGFYERNDIKFTLDILDTTGSYPFPAMRRLAMSTGDAFVLVYSIDNEESFEEAKELRKQILEERHENKLAPIVFVGNKSDLALVGKRKVLQENASMASIDWGNGHLETSAKDNRHVSDIFQEVFLQPYFTKLIKKKNNRRGSTSALLSLFQNINIGNNNDEDYASKVEETRKTSKEQPASVPSAVNLTPLLERRKLGNELKEAKQRKQSRSEQLTFEEQVQGDLVLSPRYQTRRMGFSRAIDNGSLQKSTSRRSNSS